MEYRKKAPRPKLEYSVTKKWSKWDVPECRSMIARGEGQRPTYSSFPLSCTRLAWPIRGGFRKVHSFPFSSSFLLDIRRLRMLLRRLYEESAAPYSSATSIGDICPNSGDSISPEIASILITTETRLPFDWVQVQQWLDSSHARHGFLIRFLRYYEFLDPIHFLLSFQPTAF